MKYSTIKGFDKKLSRLVFGTATPALFAAMTKKSDFFSICYCFFQNLDYIY